MGELPAGKKQCTAAWSRKLCKQQLPVNVIPYLEEAISRCLDVCARPLKPLVHIGVPGAHGVRCVLKPPVPVVLLV